MRENLLIGYPDATEADIEAALEISQAAFAYDLDGKQLWARDLGPIHSRLGWG